MVSDLDIGHAIGVHLDPNKPYLFLKNTWEPFKNYILPTKTENKHNRKFQIDWLSQYMFVFCFVFVIEEFLFLLSKIVL